MRPTARGTDGPFRPATAIASRSVGLRNVAWGEAPASPALAGSETHVWAADTDAIAQRAGQLTALLSPDERSRAARFRADADRRRFIARKAMLRKILARYSGQAPDALRLARTEFGKPALTSTGTTLRFSAASSGAVALVALRLGVDVGIDVEEIRPIPAGVMREALTPAECAAFAALSEARRTARFFEVWTGKEAVAKSLGRGLRLRLDAFSLPLRDGGGLPSIEIAVEGQTASQWWMPLAPPRAGFAAALAAGAAFGQVELWNFSGAVLG